jgi:hypothetical protein
MKIQQNILTFGQDPFSVENYSFGDTPTRENFTSLFILSFACSKGSLGTQRVFLKWLQMLFDFDMKTSLKNLKEKGGVESLTDKERQKIFEAFKRAPKHKKKFSGSRHIFSDDGRFLNLINQEIERLIVDESLPYSDDMAKAMSLENITNLGEFTRAAQKYTDTYK